MIKKIKRALYGVDPHAFKRELEKITMEFNGEKAELQQELAKLVHQRELLRDELEKLQQEIQLRISLQDNISHQLFNDLINITEHVLTEINNAETTQKDALTKVATLEDKLNAIRSQITKMTGEILSMTERYESIIEQKAGSHYEKIAE